jgi:hypothetical protein
MTGLSKGLSSQMTPTPKVEMSRHILLIALFALAVGGCAVDVSLAMSRTS